MEWKRAAFDSIYVVSYNCFCPHFLNKHVFDTLECENILESAEK